MSAAANSGDSAHLLGEIMVDGLDDARWTFLFAHGAGAPMDSPFMSFFAQALAAAGVRVVRFEFPYMRGRRLGNGSRPPDRLPVLLETWRMIWQTFGSSHRTAIGGKSMGGRIASLVADELRADALICLGYPFHPPGRPEKTRVDHLPGLTTPTLILQGERDPFGTPPEVAGYSLSAATQVAWLADGDHSFKPRRASGRTESQNWSEAAAQIAAFLN